MQTKHLFLTAILLVFSMLVVAEPVDPMRALEVAEQFAPQQAKGKGIKSKTAPEQSYEIVYTHRMPNSDCAAFYVVKLGEKGFVIISADDVANPILGYSYTNSWPTSISAQGDTLLPPQVLSYLNDMALQIETAVEKYPNLESSEEWNNVGQKAVRKSRTRKSADALPDSVGPLLTTTWGQGQYYNALCPEDAEGEDGHVPTGCVATAMAQIIHYWGQKEEIKTRGIHSYDSQYGNLRVNYDSTSYDFSNMPDALTAESTPEQIKAVAKLMYECGVAVNMEYSAWASGAQNSEVIRALVNHFRFSPEIKECLRFDYSDEEWFLALKNNLACNSPIYYSGVNDGYEGHAFICDGYNQMDYFHINFGWNGYCDGWYNLSAVSKEIGFVHIQATILPFYPKITPELYVQNNTIINISEATDLYNAFESNLVGNDIVMHFVSEDTTKQLVLDILDFRHHALLVYDGMTTNTSLKMLYPHHDYASQDKPTPVISNSNALTIVYTPLNYTEGFHLRISPESNCRTVSNIVTQIEDSTIHISWQENGESTEWLVEYGLKGFELGTGTPCIVSTNHISINQAVGIDAYEIKIQPICDTLYDDCVYSVIVNERKYWTDAVNSEPQGYYLDKQGTIHISTAEGLAWLAKLERQQDSDNFPYIYNNISIEADIDLEGYYWKPIKYWRGNIEGNGHVILNLNVVNSVDIGCEGLGMFEYFYGSVIKDIGFKNAKIKGLAMEHGGGTIAGHIMNTKVYNSYSIDCDIATQSESGTLFGSASSVEIYNCYAIGSSTSYNVASGCSGGLIGRGEIMMYNSYASVDVFKNALCWTGLLNAYAVAGIYENCYVESPTSINSFWGYISTVLELKNIAGFTKDSSGKPVVTTNISQNYNLGDIDLVTALNLGVEQYNSPMLKTWVLDSITGLPKFGDYYSVTCPNVSDIKLQNIVHNDKDAVVISWTENGEASEWEIKYLREGQNEDSAKYINTSSTQDTLRGIELGSMYKFYVRPLCDNSSVENWGEPVSFMVDKPYWDEIVTTQPEGYTIDDFGNIKITSAEGLTWLAVCSNGLHGQSMDHFERKKIEILADINLKGYRWRPIGVNNYIKDNTEGSFMGIFDGNNYKISNLYCNEENATTCGLFGYAENATILNFNLSNGHIIGDISGGVIGRATQTVICNCHFSGLVKGIETSGGLIGGANHSQLQNCSSSGDIYGDYFVGGVLGDANDVEIRNCYSIANIFQRGLEIDRFWFGGLIGQFSGNAQNCYSVGQVETVYDRFDKIVSGALFGLVAHQININSVYSKFTSLPWYADSYSQCDTCISNIGIFDEDEIITDGFNMDSNYPTHLLSALNAWVDANNAEGQYLHWVADTANVNGGYPILKQEPIALPKYIVTFCDEDGTILQQDTLEHGEMPEYREGIPTKDSTEQYNYTFTGWSPELSVVTGNQSYTAQYEATLNQYEIIFLNWDGEVLQSTMVDYGAMPEYFGVTPTKPEDDQYVYTFSGWEPEITIVVAYAEYTAQYDATDKVTTAIQNTQSDEVKTYKILRNNKIFIIRGDKVYSILGHVIEDWMPLGL